MKRYIVTGATGYIGSMIVERLLQESKKVTVIIRKPERLKETIRNRVEIIQANIAKTVEVQKISNYYDCLIHCAAPTQSAYIITKPVEVADVIVNGTKNMLELALRCHVKSMVYLSSMEVYGEIECFDGRRIKENELGILDISNIRNCYPMAKRMAEFFCNLYSKEYGVSVKIARLSQTFGRGVRLNDQRVFVQFANAARNCTDIVLHTKGESVGNYCDIDDTVDAILFLTQNGEFAEAYNIVNEENTMTIYEMAELVSKKITNEKIKILYDIPDNNFYGYAVKTGLRLSGEKIKKIGWEATIGLEDMYRSMLL